MGKMGDAIAAVLMAVIGVAIVAVLVGQNSQTGSVISSFGEAFSKILQVAVSPVTGGTQGA